MNGTNFLATPSAGVGLNRRTAILAGIYAAIVAASLYLAYEIRFDFIVPEQQQTDRLHMLPVAIGIKLLALVAARQLGSMMTYFSIPDLVRLGWAMVGSSAALFVVRLLEIPGYSSPRGVLLIDFMLCLGGLCAGRLATRLYRERLSNNTKRGHNGVHQQQQRIVIIGAGDVGASLAKEFLTFSGRGFRPVMFFDDDPDKHGKLVHGILVFGRPERIDDAKDMGTIAKAVIAMPSATAKRVREIVAVFAERGIKVETLPSVEELASGRVRASRVRPVEVQDLLGRDAVNLDSARIKQAIENRVVLVTGAGGSIGSELCRQIAALNPKRLLMIEQSEYALFTIEQELMEKGLGGAGVAVPLVADILDGTRIEFIFARYQPEIVFHAAAHKHVFMMERQPAEAIRNNAIGTRRLAEIAARHGCDAFVFISTDKAINPTSVMGATKRLAELQLMAIAARQSDGALRAEVRGQRSEVSDRSASVAASASERSVAASVSEWIAEPKIIGFQVPASGSPAIRAEQRSDQAVPTDSNPLTSDLRPLTSNSGSPQTKFMAVRFGNVLGSSGSVIPIFKRQIAHGGPVTVTHPEVTRYFMTIPEAVGLVLQSFVLGKGGEIFVLDMGQPVKIVDLAKQMIELSGFKVGDDIEITFTGLKPGEKLFEELQHKTEEYAPTEHPRIMRFKPMAASARVPSRASVAALSAEALAKAESVSEWPTFDLSSVKPLEENLHHWDSNELKTELKKLVPEYTPFLD